MQTLHANQDQTLLYYRYQLADARGVVALELTHELSERKRRIPVAAVEEQHEFALLHLQAEDLSALAGACRLRLLGEQDQVLFADAARVVDENESANV